MKTANEIKQELSRMMREIKALSVDVEYLPGMGVDAAHKLLDAVSSLRKVSCAIDAVVVPTA